MQKSMFAGLSYRMLANEYRIELCTNDYRSCERGVSRIRHIRGHVDRLGRIHWVEKSMRRTGLHRFLTLVGIVQLRLHRNDMPLYLKIYEADRWAHYEGIRRFHRRWPSRYSDWNRRTVRKNIHYLEVVRKQPQHIRKQHHSLYRWLNRSKEK